MTDVNYLKMKVAIDGRGVLSRRGFLRGVGLGAAGLSAVSFTDLMALRAEELRRRQMACIVLWMAGGPSQFETFDPKPDHDNGGGTPTIETAQPGVRIAKGWEKTAAVMDDIALIRSMTNKEGNHQRATYQMHTGYAPVGSVKHPNFGSVVAAELADPTFDLPSIVSVGAGGFGNIGAGLLGPAYEPFLVQDPLRPPNNVTVPVSEERFTRRLGLMPELEAAGFARAGGPSGSASTAPSTSRPPRWSCRPASRHSNWTTSRRRSATPTAVPRSARGACSPAASSRPA